MIIKTPKFWSKINFISLSLLPFSFVYFLGMFAIRSAKKTQKVSKKVICIGNFIAGGSGKTPTAIAIGKIIKEIAKEKNSDEKYEFSYLSGGYMGEGVDFVSLRDGGFLAQNVGDEPLLLNEIATTFVAKDRLFGAWQINRISKIKAIILDDGMQDNAIHKDFTIAVVDGKIGFGNGFLIPAGPMRQPLWMGLKKVDLVVMIGEADEEILQKLAGKEITKAKLAATNLEKFSGQKLVAFCGLAYPQKFFSFLESCGLELLGVTSFSDHYNYQDQDLQNMCKIAESKGTKLVTTKKDWIKFSSHFQEKIDYLDVELEFSDKEFIKNKVRKIIQL